MPPLLVAADEFVELHAGQPGDELQKRTAVAVALRPNVRGDGLGRLVGAMAVMEADREAGRKGLGRLTADEKREDAIVAVEMLEPLDFLVDPQRLLRVRRAEDDQRIRIPEREIDRLAKMVGGRKLLPILEDGESAAVALRPAACACRRASAGYRRFRGRDAATPAIRRSR